jgi:hypothetical protein
MGKKFLRPHLNQWLVWWCTPAFLATEGSTNRILEVQASLGIKCDPISKITNAQRAGRVTQVVELLPSKCDALS